MSVALVFGNSHTGPYLRGHRLALSKGLIEYDVHGMAFEGDRYNPYIEDTGQGLNYHPNVVDDIRAALTELNPICVITAVHGAEHWSYGMANDVRAFDFIVPGLPGFPLSSGTELIPFDLLVRRFRTDLDWQFSLVRTVREFCRVPMFHIEAPPPLESTELMLRNVGPHKERMEQFGRPSVEFRYKIWWIWTHVTREFCADLGLHFIEGPPQTRDSRGFLDVRYYLDGVHGSDEYGELMALEVKKALASVGSRAQ